MHVGSVCVGGEGVLESHRNVLWKEKVLDENSKQKQGELGKV